MRKQAFNYWLTQIHNLEKSLSIYLNNSPHMEANFRRMMEAKSDVFFFLRKEIQSSLSRTTLQQAYIHAMMIDIESSLSKNLDAQLWKSCFHNVIERFREYDKQSTDDNNVKNFIETVIEDVTLSIYSFPRINHIYIFYRANDFFLHLFVNLNQHFISIQNYILIPMPIHRN
jgi:hypothetical protein